MAIDDDTGTIERRSHRALCTATPPSTLETTSRSSYAMVSGVEPSTDPLRGDRITLEPLQAHHAPALAAALDDPALHRFIGGEPLSADAMATRVRRLLVGRSDDGADTWCNWVIRRGDDVVGTLQATIDADGCAELAWVVRTADQGRGYAREAAALVVAELDRRGVRTFEATIHPDHAASNGVARAIGLRPTREVVDGEVRWRSPG